MIPPIFIGSLVEVTGPTIMGCMDHIGERFRIWQECQDIYQGVGLPWYPASSLRLVEEELKIGDWVCQTREGSDWKGCVFRIERMDHAGNLALFSQIGLPWFVSSDLRKLTPEEIQQHLGNPISQIQAADHNYMVEMDKRLSAIEKRLDAGARVVRKLIDGQGALESRLMEDRNLMTEIEARLDERLDILEGERPEVCEGVPIEITIVRRGELPHNKVTCNPEDAMVFCKHVLDGMRSKP